jgi:DNA-binding CsgD family transcriptional regulator/tetratricopeptide (TPR) repeat protein
MVSPVLAGREDELAALEGAMGAAAAGRPATVLVGAEAGGGKSRLAAEFAARVRDRALVLAGGCVELTAGGLPYAPFVAALRELVRERGAAEVAALLPGQAGGELAALLPEFGAPSLGADPQTARVRLFELVLALLEALAENRPVALVIEDVHWADRESRDLLSFLVRNLRDAAVLLVVTFRSESLHRDHPLRRLLAGLERMDGVTRLDLPRLSRGQVAAQLAGILGRPPAPPVLGAVYQRGGGNPLFTEALLGPGGDVSPALPVSLRDLLLAMIQDLPQQAQQMVRTAAVGGSRVGHALLAAVTGLDDAALTAALRPAVAASVLVSDTDCYVFRHELIREAVQGDLLAGERAQAHRRFAETLDADPSLSLDGAAAVQVARHWLGAREIERAMIAAWRAAAGAGASFAYAEQLMMAEQVVQLWDQVPDAARQTGTDRVGVLMVAADAARWAGQPERGLALAEAALAEAGQAGEPARRASLLRRRAGLRRELLLPGQLDDLEAALRLAGAPTRVRAQVLAQLCWALRREDRHQQAGQFAWELQALADQLGDDECQAEAVMLQAAVAAHKGQDTLGALWCARDKAASIGSGHLEAWVYLTASHVLAGRGSHELAIAAGRDGLARARQLGLARQVAAPIAGNLAESLTFAGRWDEALEILEEILGLDQPPRGRVAALLVRGQIAAARGDLETAERTLGELRALPAGLHAEAHYALPLARLEIECQLAAGDLAGAVVAARMFPRYNPEADPRYPWALLATAMRACAEASALSLPSGAGGPAELRDDLQSRAARVARLSPLHDAYAAVFAAEAARADGRPDLAGWDAATAAWEVVGQPYPLAYALLRAAGAAAAAADRDGAASRLRRAAGLAGQLAAQPLQQQVSQLARRARIELPTLGGDAVGGAGVPFGLTPRELEVLRLVAAGRGNRDIAAELFISHRTASVHVSNILGKLGVSSRGEAAAAAHRLHLFDQP